MIVYGSLCLIMVQGLVEYGWLERFHHGFLLLVMVDYG